MADAEFVQLELTKAFGEPVRVLTGASTWLTRPKKDTRMPIIRALADGETRSDVRGLPLGGEDWRLSGLQFSVCLLRAGAWITVAAGALAARGPRFLRRGPRGNYQRPLESDAEGRLQGKGVLGLEDDYCHADSGCREEKQGQEPRGNPGRS